MSLSGHEYQDLEAALRRLAAEPLPNAAAIEAHVLAEFDRAVARRAAGKLSAARWAVAVGFAASLLLAALLTISRTPARPSVAASHEEAPFLTIPYSIPLAPEERAEVVRMRIPVTALLAAGYHVDVADASAVIDADALVSQDGRVRAIRPITLPN